jgi:hypothetical protein
MNCCLIKEAVDGLHRRDGSVAKAGMHIPSSPRGVVKVMRINAIAMMSGEAS